LPSQLVPVTEIAPPTGIYLIRNETTGLVLEIQRSTPLDAKYDAVAIARLDPKRMADQQWALDHSQDNTGMRIRELSFGNGLAAFNPTLEQAIRCERGNPYNNGSNRIIWLRANAKPTDFSILFKSTGKVVTLQRDAAAPDGYRVTQATHDTTNQLQHFQFILLKAL
jgi:hypothetical protein